jgi:hypothetical protein
MADSSTVFRTKYCASPNKLMGHQPGPVRGHLHLVQPIFLPAQMGQIENDVVFHTADWPKLVPKIGQKLFERLFAYRIRHLYLPLLEPWDVPRRFMFISKKRPL